MQPDIVIPRRMPERPAVFVIEHVPSDMGIRRDLYCIDSSGDDVSLIDCIPMEKAGADESGHPFMLVEFQSEVKNGCPVRLATPGFAKVYFPDRDAGIVATWFVLTLVEPWRQ